MSLYRAWRPKSFGELVGQDAVVRTLTSALESGKLAHAYLFSGPRGSGKTSAAKILARCIDCVNGPTPTPDNTCENCRAIIDGTALDVLEIDAASNRGIDEIRALRDAVKFAPASMRMKVYIIDEAHMLTKEGANAFLKTLEEPPPHAIFILATTEPDRLPLTILSRCQRYAFRRISVPVMIDRMRAIAAAEGIGIEDEALTAIAYRADGGLRDALTMLEQAAAFAGATGGRIEARTIELAFGSAGREQARNLLDGVLERDAAAVLQTIEEASDAGTDMQLLTRSLVEEFRNLLVARVDPELLARDLAPEDAERAVQRAPTVSQATIVRALRVLGDALALARGGGNPRLELETSLLRFILSQEDPSLDALAARVAALEGHGSNSSSALVIPSEASKASGVEGLPKSAAPTKSAAPSKHTARVIPSEANAVSAVEEPTKPAATGTSSEISLQRLRAAWQSIRGKVEGERQSLRAPLSRAIVEGIEGNAVTLALPDSWSAGALRDHAKLIETAIADVLGASLKVRMHVAGAGTRAKHASAPAPQDDLDELLNYANEVIREKR